MGKITPFLWFDQDAEEAMSLYCSLFEDAKVHSVTRYPEGSPLPAGTVITARFELAGQEFIALNGGPTYHFTEAVSFSVRAETQEEIDRLWDALTADGGEPGRCGWLKDRFGLSWQIVPPVLTQLLSDPDPATAGRVMQAMLAMSKLEHRRAPGCRGRPLRGLKPDTRPRRRGRVSCHGRCLRRPPGIGAACRLMRWSTQTDPGQHLPPKHPCLSRVPDGYGH